MYEVEFSERVIGMLAALTQRQRAAIPRLVETLAEGGSVRSLLHGPDKICTERTFYRKGRGWSHQPYFREVWRQAQEEYERLRLTRSVEDAAERLRRLTPRAVEAAGLVMAGLFGDEEQGLTAPVATLLQAAQDGELKPGQVRAGSVLLARGLQAAVSILDRADIKTAMKGTGGDAQRVREWLAELRQAGDGEMADVESETNNVPADRVLSSRAAGASAQEPGGGSAGGGGGEIG